MSHRLGIIDWGIGGISIYKLMREKCDVPITYLSDTGVTPYGKMSRKELSTRLDRVIECLKQKGVTHLVIGCNAASTAIDDLAHHDIPILGVIGPAIDATAKLKPKDLALLGGRRTVVSGVYRRAFDEREIDVRQRIAQPLSALIESGDVSSDKLRSAAKMIVTPVRNASHILLACTHYPAISPVLRSLVSRNTKFIDPAEAVLRKAMRWKLHGRGRDVFLTTGDATAMQVAASNAFGVELSTIQRIAI